MVFPLLTGCGRLDFDPQSDASSPRCNATAPFTAIQPIAELDTPATEGALRLSDDELVAYFHSDRGSLFQIWTATRARRDLPFDPPTPMLAFNSLWPALSADALTVVYNDSVANLYVSMRPTVDDAFAPGSVLPTIGASSAGASFGRATPTLYLAHAAPDAKIVRVPWPDATPATVIAELDTPVDEGSATLSTDERLIYFARGSSGNYDIYMATRPDVQSTFDPPVLVSEVNSSVEDAPTWLSPDQCRLYFESARDGVSDVYLAERVP